MFHRQDVTEDGSGFIEGDAVVVEVRRCLLRIPFEAVRHFAILPSFRSFRELIGITAAFTSGPLMIAPAAVWCNAC